MAKNTRIILLEDIKNLGVVGDIISTSEGYAQNFLFPQGKAALATDQVEEEYKRKETKKVNDAEKELTKASKKAEEFDGTEIIMEAKVKDGSDIYGSIKKKEIIKAIQKETKLKLKEKDVEVEAPIKQLGSYEATINQAEGVEYKVTIVVEADKESREKLEKEEE